MKEFKKEGIINSGRWHSEIKWEISWKTLIEFGKWKVWGHSGSNLAGMAGVNRDYSEWEKTRLEIYSQFGGNVEYSF